MDAKIKIKQAAKFHGHEHSVYALCRLEGRQFLSAGGDGMLIAWDPENPAQGLLKARIPEPVYSILQLPGSGTLLAGSASGKLYALLPDGPRVFEAHVKGIFALYAQNGGGFLTAGGDGMLLQWNADLEIQGRYRVAGAGLRCILRAGELWICGSSDHNIYALNNSFREVEKLEGHRNTVFAICQIDKDRLVSGGRDARLCVWDLNGLKMLDSIDAHNLHIHALAMNESAGILASGSMDKAIRLWATPEMELQKVLDKKYDGHNSSVNSLLWMDEHTLISASDDRSMIAWSFK
jgi:WD40 repeat protein